MTRHPYTEFDANEEIGRLKWRIARRAERLRDSQDGAASFHLEQSLEKDRAALRAALAAQEQKP
jgi:hypothetical protein